MTDIHGLAVSDSLGDLNYVISLVTRSMQNNFLSETLNAAASKASRKTLIENSNITRIST